MHCGEFRFQYFYVVDNTHPIVRSQLRNKFNSHRKRRQIWGLCSSGVVTQRKSVFVNRRFRRAYLSHFKGQAVQEKCQERMETCLYSVRRWWLVLRASLKYHNVTFTSQARHISRYSDWLRAGRSGDLIPVWARFSTPVQTGSGAHPASCTMGIERPGRDADTSHPPRAMLKKE